MCQPPKHHNSTQITWSLYQRACLFCQPRLGTSKHDFVTRMNNASQSIWHYLQGQKSVYRLWILQDFSYAKSCNAVANLKSAGTVAITTITNSNFQPVFDMLQRGSTLKGRIAAPFAAIAATEISCRAWHWPSVNLPLLSGQHFKIQIDQYKLWLFNGMADQCFGSLPNWSMSWQMLARGRSHQSAWAPQVSICQGTSKTLCCPRSTSNSILNTQSQRVG